MRSTCRWFSTVTFLLASCTNATPALESARPLDGVAPPEQVEERQEAAHLQAAFVAAHARAAGLTFSDLEARRSPTFLASHGLEVKKAAHYEKFASAFGLTAEERAKLDELGSPPCV